MFFSNLHTTYSLKRFFHSFNNNKVAMQSTGGVVKPYAKNNKLRKGKKKEYRPRTVKNYWWLKGFIKRKKFYRFWKTVTKKRYVKMKPFSAQRRRLKLYRSWIDRKRKFPYRYRTIKALASMPKYINYKQLFHNQVLEKQTFRKLFRLTHTQLIKHFRKATKNSKRLFDMCFVKHFELRLDVVVYRANLAFSYLQARQQVRQGLFKINNLVINRPNYTLNVSDCVTPTASLIASLEYQLLRLWARPLQVDQYPNYMMVNERVPAILIFANPNINQIKHTLPVSWKFITFSMLKYN